MISSPYNSCFLSRKLIQKRKNFEYRLARRTKGKAEIINYVNYEKKLLELLKLRRKVSALCHTKRRKNYMLFLHVQTCTDRIVYCFYMCRHVVQTWEVAWKRKQYLISILSLQQLHMNEKKDSIDNAIAKRCIENLMTLTRTWPRHLDTWALRIQFAEFLGWKEEVCELDGFQSLKSQYIYIYCIYVYLHCSISACFLLIMYGKNV